MINLTKEQIKETLVRLKDYSGWMYFSEDCHSELPKQKIKHKDHEFFLDVRKDGLIEIILENGKKGVYNVRYTTGPILGETLNNIDAQIMLLNKGELSEDEIKYFEEIGIFVASYFQRAISLIFFSRMQDVTIDGIVTCLERYNDLERT